MTNGVRARLKCAANDPRRWVVLAAISSVFVVVGVVLLVSQRDTRGAHAGFLVFWLCLDAGSIRRYRRPDPTDNPMVKAGQ